MGLSAWSSTTIAILNLFLDPRLLNTNKALRNTVSDLERKHAIELQQLSNLTAALESVQERELDLQDKLQRMQASSSWRLTAPIRHLVDFFRR